MILLILSLFRNNHTQTAAVKKAGRQAHTAPSDLMHCLISLPLSFHFSEWMEGKGERRKAAAYQLFCGV
jgi:hypothetical protein